MKDTYGRFAELKAKETEGVDYLVQCTDRGSRVLVLAPHGGGIEPGTSEIVKAVAGEDLSFYLFEGIKPRGNYETLHITSTSFDEPRALELLTACDKSIAIHGEKSSEEIAFIGGGDAGLRPHIERFLKEAGFVVRQHDSPGLRGRSPGNICNRCRSGAGLQLELSRGLRERLFRSLGRDGRRHTNGTFSRFVHAIREGLGYANLL
jgi:phage replication-related protein YjqB (UPF0714/DUF867 family)